LTRLWSSGFELQTVATGVEFTSIIATPVIETTTFRSGVAALRINNTVAEGFRQVHTAAQGAFFFRFYLYIVTLPPITGPIGGFRITGAYKVVIRLTATGALQLYNIEDSAQVGSDSSALSTATWYRVEIKCDSTTLASTVVEANAYADTPGASSFWNPSGTIDLAANPAQVGCAHLGDLTLDYIVDDCAVNDTTDSFQNSWPGEGELIIQRPDAAGDNSAWTRGGTDSGANWSQVEEFPPNDATDYVLSNTAGTIDDYNLEATPAAMAADDVINWVGVGVRAANDVATGADPDIVLRIKASAGGTVEETGNLDCNSVTWKSPQPLPANDNYAAFPNDSNYQVPGTANAWTKADLDTAQIGMRESVTDTHNALVSAIWLYVDHKPAVVGGDPEGSLLGGKLLRGGLLTHGVLTR